MADGHVARSPLARRRSYRIAREQAHAAGVSCCIDESLDPGGRIIRHDPDGTRHVLADGDEDDIVSLPP